VTVAERGLLRTDTNGTAGPSPHATDLAERVFVQAARTPDATAVTFGDDRLTYRELVGRANRLADRLRERGVGPDVPVALALERSLDLPVAVLAVLAAGGAYVPIDPNYPPDRTAFMLGDCGATILITQSTVRLPAHSLRTLLLDQNPLESQPGLNGFANPPGADHLAYIIYTSGSTGRPKGVAMRRGALSNLIHWQLGDSAMGPGDVTLQFASLSFDVSFQEIFSTWCSGGTLAIVPESLRYDPEGLLRLIDEQNVARLFLPVVVLHQLAEAAAAAGRYPAGLREVFTAGEALQITPAVREFFTKLPGCRLHNHYGPSETHVVTAHLLTGPPGQWPALPPIGRPIQNAVVYLTDADLQPVPDGEAGELLIGGACLARGYVNQPELTAERFISISNFKLQIANCPDKSEICNLKYEILYRTGDLARLRPDGEIEFLGRADQQVKIRGYRIEPGEVETALRRHPGVGAAAVVAREDVPGDRRLVAYFVPKDSAPPADELRQFLAASLPEYMIPATFVPSEQLPLTPSGKLDRRALPVPERERPALQSTFAPPRTEMEEKVAQVWRDVLRLDRVGIDDRFADLGGHSLAAARVHVALQKALDRTFPIVILFQHATIRELAAHLAGATIAAPADRAQLPAADPTVGAVAVIGMAGRFPGATNVDQFWRNLCDGVESISVFSDQELLAAGVDPALLTNPDYVKARGVLPDADLFDAAFFGFQPREAELLDPQHRVFLETCWTALEHSGYDPDRYRGNIGVYAGSSLNTYLLANICSSRAVIDDLVGGYQVTGFPTVLGNGPDYLPTRVSYKLNLRGPSMAVQTACSTSLVAVCQACDALLAGQCDAALAGGVSISFPQRRGYLYSEGAMVSPDGHCRAFDAEAAGTVFGEGAGVVVLKRLADAVRDGDKIYAVVRGTAVNNDGSAKVSYLAPSVDGQATAISKALTRAGIDAGSIRYVEAHGTGTPLGDPIEVAALTQAFRADSSASGYCALGSVKPNVGHLEAASGVTGLIKTVLALHHDRLPPTLHYSRPNPRMDIDASPFRVVDRLSDWPAGTEPRRAGVSSLGVGGTNAHVVLEEAPPAPVAQAGKTRQLLLLSARTSPALETATHNLAAYLRNDTEAPLADVAYTLQIGRRPFEHRRMIVCRDAADAVAALDANDTARVLTGSPLVADPPVAFLFPGQGAQFVGMAAETYAGEPVFREALDRCAESLRPHLGIDIRSTLYPSPQTEAEANERLRQTAVTQPALFAIEYALAQLWMSWGVRPAAMFGHSVGEFVAACLADVFSLDDALMLVALRGRLVQSMPPGWMLAVRMAEADVLPLLGPELALAAVNGPSQCVVSGPADAVAALQTRLGEQEIVCRPLATSHAFHSPMLEPVLDRFAAAVAGVKRNSPTIPFLSCVSGTWINPEQAIDPSYWAAHLRQTVRCADALGTLAADGHVLLEVGPGRTLTNLARHQTGAAPTVVVSTLPRPEDDDTETAALLTAVGRLWLAGVTIDWDQFHAPARRRRVPLPTYPFERQRFWIEPPGRSTELLPVVQEAPPPEPARLVEPVSPPAGLPASVLPILQSVFAELSGVSGDRLDPKASFFELGFDSLFLTQAVLAVQNRFGVRVSFRQLLEDLSSLDTLATYLDRFRPVLEAKPATVGKPETAASPPAAEPAQGFGALAPIDRAADTGLSPRQAQFLDALIARVTRRTAGSKCHVQHHRAHHADPRTVSGFNRRWKEMVYPIVVDRSAGARLWDVDGNEYIDLLNSFGPDFFGHSPDFVVRAVEEQLRRGYEVGPMSPLAGEVARLVCDLTGMERASFVCTGSEAVQAAVRAARTVTGRNLVALFARDYHGNFDEVLVRALGGRAAPSVPGIPPSSVENVLVLDYGSSEALAVIRDRATELAAVLVEPVQSRRPEWQPREFLHEIRRITERSGTALIFDEVITGFRLHPSGAQAFYGVSADLATYGKVAGGGLPIGIVAGRAAFMDAFDGGTWQYGDDSMPEAGRTFFAGTFVRQPLALAAARAALTRLKEAGPALQERLNAKAAGLVAELNAIVDRFNVPLRVVHCGSILFFRVLDSRPATSLLFYLLRDKGVYILEGFPSYLSTAHTDDDLKLIVRAFRDSVEELHDAGFFDEPHPAAVAGEIRVPSTESQRGLWLACQMSATASCAFNETCSFRLRGPLDLPALRRAIQTLVDRHESLRSVFDESGEYQLIRPIQTAAVPVTDLSAFAAAEREQAVAALAESADLEPFDLQAGPLWRFQLLRLAADDHVLLLVIHHLICDGWSYDILLQELGTLYGAAHAGRPHGLPEPSRFSDYAREQAALARDGRARSRAFWLAKYESLPPALELPADRPRGNSPEGHGARLIESLGAELTARMKQAAGRLGCTPYAVLLANFQALVHRLSGTTDVVLGVPVAGQAVTGKQKLVGRCINFLPLRQTVDPDQSFVRLAAAAKRTLLDAYDYQDFTYVGLMQELQHSRGINRPLVTVSFNIDPQLCAPAFDGLACEVRKTPKHFVGFDVNLNLVDTGADYTIEWEYDSDLFTEDTSRHWMGLFRTYLDEAVARPDISVGALPAPLLRPAVAVSTPISPPPTFDARDRIAPTTDAEKELRKVWVDVLGVPDLSVADNFFDRGGHSLLAARLVAEIRRRLGHDLPLSAFYTAPTVASMARVIETRLEAGTERALVPLCETGRRPPLFLIAGIGGHVFAFHQFARLLGTDQPTYAFKAIGVDGRREPLDRMEDIAGEYVREMVAACPDGPYVVGGYSIGATVALEVVLQLRALGKKAPLLLAFDMTGPGYPPDRSLAGKIWFHGRNLLFGRNRLVYLRDRYRNMLRRVRRLIGREILDAPHIEGVEAFPQDALKRVWVGLETAYRRYWPQGQFDGGLGLFRATELDEWAAQTWLDPQLGWRNWVTGPIETFSAAVAHTELFHENNIANLAEQVRGCIDGLTAGP
jgi:amino acid adenylation domain-containing protein